MCRQNQMWGAAVLAFGLGVLIGTWLESGFFCHIFGFGLIFLGTGVMRRH